MDKRLRKALKGLLDLELEHRRRAMETFVRLTFENFMRCLYRHLGNEVECEDVLENVYADIWEKSEYLAHIGDEREVLRTVYMYYMRKRLRQVYRRLNRNLHLSQESLSMLVAPQISVLEMLSDAERSETVGRMLGKLKARERRAMELWMEGMSIRAIADELKTTVGAVKMLKYRTILKLKEQVKAMNIKVE